jgi:hypothetical protein
MTITAKREARIIAIMAMLQGGNGTVANGANSRFTRRRALTGQPEKGATLLQRKNEKPQFKYTAL